MFQIYTLIKQIFTTPLVLQLVFAALISSLFFDIKYPIITSFGYVLGEKKDFTIIFAHLSDIFLIILIFDLIRSIFLLNKLKFAIFDRKENILLLSLMLLIIKSYYLNFSNLLLPTISIYILLFLTKLIVLHGTLTVSLKDLFKTFKVVFLLFIGLESALGIYQFYSQASFGLQKIGESIIGPYVFGVAKVEALGEVFIRSYGTFPHPNVFAAFLVTGLLISFASYLYASIRTRLILLFLINMQLLALALSFSRSAWFAMVLSITVFICLTWNKGLDVLRKLILPIVATIISLTIIIVILFPLIQSRGQVYDSAYSERVSYNTIGLQIIKNKPIFGVGPGQSLLHMKQYMDSGAQPWELQPIHNYYLLLATEVGVPVLLIFMLYIIYIMRQSLTVYIINGLDIELVCLLTCLVAMLVLMFFDHYFYTLQSPAILFWVVLGLLANKVWD